MARLQWGDIAKRVYETGVDRGVLYVGTEAAPWEGLVSIDVVASGGEAQAFHIDGYKYLNVSGPEDAGLTIEAFTYPDLFLQCDGSVQIDKGLFVNNQFRTPFGMAYRTHVADQSQGTDLGYKLHIIFNALASPTSHTSTTENEAIDPSTFSWQVTMRQEPVKGYKPTAHLTIDSRKTPKGLLKKFEEILYGTETANPRLPLPQEIFELFETEGPLTRRNHFTNPTYRAAGGSIEVRRNFGLIANLGKTTDSTIQTNNVEFGGDLWTKLDCLSPGDGYGTNLMTVDPPPIQNGEPFVGSFEVANPSEEEIELEIQFASAVNVAYTIGPLGRTRIYTSIQRQDYYGNLNISVVSRVSDTTFLIRNPMFEKHLAYLPYFDGDTPDADGLSYSWTTTTRDGAISIATSKVPIGIPPLRPNPELRCWVTETDSLKATVVHLLGSDSVILGGNGIPAIPNELWSCRVKVRQVLGSPIIIYGLLGGSEQNTNFISGVRSPNVQLSAEGGWKEIVINGSLMPAGTHLVMLLIRNQGLVRPNIFPGTVLEFKEGIIEKALTSGPYFDGSSQDERHDFYKWEGEPDNSTSTLNTWN
jgi:hypothetical protein